MLQHIYTLSSKKREAHLTVVWDCQQGHVGRDVRPRVGVADELQRDAVPHLKRVVNVKRSRLLVGCDLTQVQLLEHWHELRRLCRQHEGGSNNLLIPVYQGVHDRILAARSLLWELVVVVAPQDAQVEVLQILLHGRQPLQPQNGEVRAHQLGWNNVSRN